MVVTATEFKTNFGKYLDLIAHEDIFITKNGKMDVESQQIECHIFWGRVVQALPRRMWKREM